jgi:hypothetical protein
MSGARKYIPTVLLLVVCAALFGVAYKNNFFQKKEVVPQAISAVNTDEVKGVTIVSDGETVKLDRQAQSWTIAQPAGLPLNQTAVTSWLSAWNLVTDAKVVEENVSELNRYGLDQPKQQFTIVMKDGSVHKLVIGESTPIAGFVYATKDGGNTVYQLGEQSVTDLNKKAFDFIEHSPITYDIDKVKGITVKWKDTSWTLAKKDLDKPALEAAWQLGDKELKAAEAGVPLNAASLLNTDQLVKKAADVKLSGAELQIDVKLSVDGKDKVETYRGKAEGDYVWILKDGGEWAYAIKLTDIQSLADQGKK